MFQQDARGDQCDACGKLINATELKVGLLYILYMTYMQARFTISTLILKAY
jgi:methionyl-tRNA synthetase